MHFKTAAAIKKIANRIAKECLRKVAEDKRPLHQRADWWKYYPEHVLKNDPKLFRELVPDSASEPVAYERILPYLYSVKDAARMARSNRLYKRFGSYRMELAEPKKYPYFVYDRWNSARPALAPELGGKYPSPWRSDTMRVPLLSALLHDFKDVKGERWLDPVLVKDDAHPVGVDVAYTGNRSVSTKLAEQTLPHLELLRELQIQNSRFKKPSARRYFLDSAEQKRKAAKEGKPLPMDIPLPDDVKADYPAEEDQIGIKQDANYIGKANTKTGKVIG